MALLGFLRLSAFVTTGSRHANNNHLWYNKCIRFNSVVGG
jgi:hypothetical protein